MKEGRKEVVRLPENSAASRTDPTHTIPAINAQKTNKQRDNSERIKMNGN